MISLFLWLRLRALLAALFGTLFLIFQALLADLWHLVETFIDWIIPDDALWSITQSIILSILYVIDLLLPAVFKDAVAALNTLFAAERVQAALRLAAWAVEFLMPIELAIGLVALWIALIMWQFLAGTGLWIYHQFWGSS